MGAWRRSFLPSRNLPATRFGWLLSHEWRELLASRAFWLLLVMIGPLVGHSFITAVDTYAEASGAGGGPAALAQEIRLFAVSDGHAGGRWPSSVRAPSSARWCIRISTADR